MDNFEPYELNEADIDKTIAYLKTIDPDHATPEDAIAYLEYYRTVIHELGHQLSDKELSQLYDDFSAWVLKTFSVFCMNHYPDETTITKAMAMQWAERRQDEN